MTIYFIDEDHPKLLAWIIELEYRGYHVKPVKEADAAFDYLQNATDVELAIIDVMLAASARRDSFFTEERTDAGLITGLVLLDRLMQARSDIFPNRAQLLTAATNRHPYFAARDKSENLGIPLVLKTDIDSSREFGNVVEKAILAARHREGGKHVAR